MVFKNNLLVFISVYVRYKNSAVAISALDIFTVQLTYFDCITDKYPNAQIILGGNFAVDFCRTSLHTTLLNLFFKLEV
jgi:hypothetical protein